MSIAAIKLGIAAIDSCCSCDQCYAAITALRTAIAEAEKSEPFCYLYYERGEEMFAPPDGYRPDDAQALYLAPQPTAIAEAEACEPVAWFCCVPGQNPCLRFDEPSDEQYPPGYKDPLFLSAVAQPAPKQEPAPTWTDADIAKMHRLAAALDSDETAPVQAQPAKPLTREEISDLMLISIGQRTLPEPSKPRLRSNYDQRRIYQGLLLT